MMNLEGIKLTKQIVECHAQIDVLVEMELQIDHKIEALRENIKTYELIYKQELKKAQELIKK